MARGRMQVARALFAWTFGLILAVGTLDLHGGAVEHGVHALEGIMVSEGARHPLQARHMEAPDLEFHPGCSACLLRMQTVGVSPQPPARLSSPSHQAAPPDTLASFRPAAVLASGSPRAPPVSPVLVSS